MRGSTATSPVRHLTQPTHSHHSPRHPCPLTLILTTTIHSVDMRHMLSNVCVTCISKQVFAASELLSENDDRRQPRSDEDEGHPSSSEGSGHSVLHVTRTYFWLHLVHFHSTVVQRATGQLWFRTLLQQCPSLADHTLIRDYYSVERLSGAEAARNMVLPDLKPLPSVLPEINNKWS